MRRAFRRIAAAGPLVLASAGALAGCPSVPLMQTAETVPEGGVQHGIGAEWLDTSVDDPGGADEAMLPLIPTYTVRIGVAEHLDIGLRTGMLMNVAFDVKLHVIDTDTLDVAIAPGVQFAWFWGAAQLPLIVGINLGDSVQVLLNGRAAWFALLTAEASGIDPAFEDNELFVGAGGGIYVKAGTSLGIMPEVSYLRGTQEGAPAVWSFSVSFLLGTPSGHRPPAQAPPRPSPAARPAPTPPSSPPPPAGYAPPAPTEGTPPPDATPWVPPGYGAPTPTSTPPPAPP